ncbi:guanylate-binding protein 4-like isoform X3 [Antechinus flavipes]|uniref:guanylate-binding protein 4-like isoform X3 n=1 Tax=Antechinus flavipes TaxID=38775 RepID=UPI002236ACA2|nr:guanylate-binding protein 4-like isoform X3 [Antechinus flavipes]
MSLAVFMETPICLVENIDGELKLNPHALQILTSITKPVVVVAITGQHCTGKSYLMKRLAGSNPFFSLGSTVQSETKGIWMWCVPHCSKLDHVLVLLDTEGLGDVEKADSKNDSWIFALAVLLSSTLVYNSMNTINQQALEQMQYVTELTKLIKVKSSPNAAREEESEEFVGFFPDFVWTVRDFTQELKADGCPITSDQYLENALKLSHDMSPRSLPLLLPSNSQGDREITDKNGRVEMANLSRECIRKFFPKRNCFIFHRPTEDKSLLACLQHVPDRQLEPSFRNQIDRFCYYILSNAKPKTLSGVIMINGRRLGKLLETYVRAISSGDVPCLENAVLSLAQTENPAAVQKAAKHYMKQMALKVDLPTETFWDLLSVHTECEKEALSIFMKHSFKDENLKYQNELVQILETKKESFIHQNEELSTEYCQTQLEYLLQSLREAISKGTFSVPGGYNRFKKKREEIINNYYQMPRKGLKADEALQMFLQSLAVTEDYILQIDQALTEQEKALEAEQSKREAAEKEKLLKQQQVEMQQKMKANQRSYKENISQLNRKMVEDRYKILEEQEMIQDPTQEEQVKRIVESLAKLGTIMDEYFHLQAKIMDIADQNSRWLHTLLDITDIAMMVILPVEGKLAALWLRVLATSLSK